MFHETRQCMIPLVGNYLNHPDICLNNIRCTNLSPYYFYRATTYMSTICQQSIPWQVINDICDSQQPPDKIPSARYIHSRCSTLLSTDIGVETNEPNDLVTCLRVVWNKKGRETKMSRTVFMENKSIWVGCYLRDSNHCHSHRRLRNHCHHFHLRRNRPHHHYHPHHNPE